MPVEHLTGSERADLERKFGKLQQVGDRGDLVRVPDEISAAHREVDRAGNLVAVHSDERGDRNLSKSAVRGDVESKAAEKAREDAESNAKDDNQDDSAEASPAAPAAPGAGA